MSQKSMAPKSGAEMARAELAGIVDAVAGMLADTRLEDDLADLLWSFFDHRKVVQQRPKA